MISRDISIVVAVVCAFAMAALGIFLMVATVSSCGDTSWWVTSLLSVGAAVLLGLPFAILNEVLDDIRRRR